MRKGNSASGFSLLLGIHDAHATFSAVLGCEIPQSWSLQHLSCCCRQIHVFFVTFSLACISCILVLVSNRDTYINGHGCILSSCLLAERETRDLHREWKTSGDRDPDSLLQNHAGICNLVRGAALHLKLPFFFLAGEGWDKNRVFVWYCAWKGRYLRKK